jgi:hypothetical protein
MWDAVGGGGVRGGGWECGRRGGGVGRGRLLTFFLLSVEREGGHFPLHLFAGSV